MGRPGGLKEAAKLLSGLEYENRINVLEIIAKQDPVMAELLKKSMVDFEDLKALTPSMFMDFFKEIPLEKMGLALRIADPELKQHVLSNVSKGMREEMEEVLNGPPRKLSEVTQAVDEILEVTRKMIEKGKIVINKDGTDEYV